MKKDEGKMKNEEWKMKNGVCLNQGSRMKRVPKQNSKLCKSKVRLVICKVWRTEYICYDS